MGVSAEVRDFVLAHRPCAGPRHADAGVPTVDGYRLIVVCGCGAEFKRWGCGRGLAPVGAPGIRKLREHPRASLAGRALPVSRRDSSDDKEHADPNCGNGGSHPGLRPRVDLARSEHHHHQADAYQEHAGASDDRETDREHPHRASFAAALPSPQSAWPWSLAQADCPQHRRASGEPDVSLLGYTPTRWSRPVGTPSRIRPSRPRVPTRRPPRWSPSGGRALRIVRQDRPSAEARRPGPPGARAGPPTTAQAPSLNQASPLRGGRQFGPT